MSKTSVKTYSRDTELSKIDEKIIAKIKSDEKLSADERKRIVDSWYPGYLKSKRLTNGIGPQLRSSLKGLTTQNKKVQVCISSKKDFTSQTDPVIDYDPTQAARTALQNAQRSKRLAATDKPDLAEVERLMNESFDERRTYILTKNPPVAFVKEKYPLLFSVHEVRNEIDRIFYRGKCESFLKNISKYATSILDMASDDNPLLTKIKEKVNRYKTPLQKRYATEVGAILMLSSLVNEDRCFLKLQDHPGAVSIFPFIEGNSKFGDIFFDQHLFRIHVEGILVCEASDFKEALLCLVGCYYIFDVKYQDKCYNTFVVFEKIFLESIESDEIDDFTKNVILMLQAKVDYRTQCT